MFKLNILTQKKTFRFARLYVNPNSPNGPKKPAINPKFELPKKLEDAPKPADDAQLTEQEKQIQATVRQIQESVKLKAKYGIVGMLNSTHSVQLFQN